MDCPFIIEPSLIDRVPLSHECDSSQTLSMTVEVLNDASSYVTFKKVKSVGHAEPSDTLPDNSPLFNVFKTDIEYRRTLKDMYRDNISELSDEQKT